MQRTWEVTEIRRIAETMAAVGRSDEFAAGVLALAYALNAPVRLELRRAMSVIVDVPAQELPQ